MKDRQRSILQGREDSLPAVAAQQQYHPLMIHVGRLKPFIVSTVIHLTDSDTD